MPTDPLIAGRLPARELLARLALQRPVFHSEADFQHAFARALWETDHELQVRLEVGQHGDKSEHLDLLVLGPAARTAVEFKYFTRRWTGPAGPAGEPYNLRSHAATDLARLGFIQDIERLERFGATTGGNGLAIMLTNEPNLWSNPRPRTKPTRDTQFRIHAGQTLTGTLLWGAGDYPKNTVTLASSYSCAWHPYSTLHDGSQLQYLIVETHSAH